MSINSIPPVGAAQEAQLNDTARKAPSVTPPGRNIANAVVAVNQGELFGPGNELAFAVDRRTHSFIIRLIDRATGTVVRQVPSEEVLRLASATSRDGFQTA